MKRWHIITIVLLLFAWIAAQIFGAPKPEYSSLSNSLGGTSAFRLILSAYNPNVNSHLHQFKDLKGTNNVLIIIEPKTRADITGLKEWIESGNTIVIFGSNNLDNIKSLGGMYFKYSSRNEDKDDIIDTFISDFKNKSDSSVRCDSEFLNTICRGVSKISYFDGKGVSADENIKNVAFVNETPFLSFADLGNGRIWHFSDASIITNRKISKADNLRLAYQVVTDDIISSDNQQILFDEFHHGFTAPVPSETQGEYYSLLVFAGYVGFLLIIFSISRAIRLGPPNSESSDLEPKEEEFSAVLGLLYYDYGAVEALDYYIDAWKARVEKKFGVSKKYPLNAVLVELQVRGVIDGARKVELEKSFREIKVGNNIYNRTSRDVINRIESLF